MTSSPKEILSVLEAFIKSDMVGIGAEPETRYYPVVYDKFETLDKVLAPYELNNLPNSKNIKQAMKEGITNENKIIDYCKKIADEAGAKAKETGETQEYDYIGLFNCMDKEVECSWDYVGAVVTPDGEHLFIRRHTW